MIDWAVRGPALHHVRPDLMYAFRTAGDDEQKAVSSGLSTIPAASAKLRPNSMTQCTGAGGRRCRRWSVRMRADSIQHLSPLWSQAQTSKPMAEMLTEKPIPSSERWAEVSAPARVLQLSR